MLGVSAILLVAALYALNRIIGDLSVDDVFASLAGTEGWRVPAAIVLTIASYAALVLYDVLALRQLDRKLPASEIVSTSFTAFSIGYNLGLVFVSAGALRLRPYTAAGLSTLEVAGVMAFGTLTFILGAWTILTFALLFEPAASASVLRLPIASAQPIGAILLLGLSAYLLISAGGPRVLTLFGKSWRLPGLRMTLAQIGVAVVDLFLAAAALLVLLPAVHVSLLAFVGLYVVAITAGLGSSVPGGIGVFETILIILIPELPPNALVGPLLLYRIVYFVLPFAVALAWLGAREIRSGRGWLPGTLATLRWWVEWLGPQLLAAAVFMVGTILLLSGATPGLDRRMATLADAIPEPVLELSHLAGSTIGLGLLIVARGLYRRVDAAWWVTLVLCAGGIVAELLKGIDYEEATLLLLIMIALWGSRRRFTRRAPLFERRFSTLWFIGIAFVLGLAIWLGLAAYRDVPYEHDLWWEFAFESDAPRWLRASLVTVLIVAGLSLWQLAGRSSRLAATQPAAEDLERAAACIASSRDTVSNLALLGDKQLLFSKPGDAFIMFQRSGRSFVALGDPVGNPERHAALAWRFRELCDLNDALPVFYEVSSEKLPLYLDLGLALIKLGEEARVNLATFTLEGPQRAELRTANRKGQREGLEFAVAAPEEVVALMPQLQEVSDQWLSAKATAEKGFSVGSFDPDYIRRFPCAIVRRGGEIVAFANLWHASDKSELTVDLMRYSFKAPKGVMDYLFVEIILYGKKEGYAWFNLGMAPLSGLERHPLAPFWHKLGLLVHRYGEPFYNFEGLRKYKEKFNPVWRPRYLVSPGGLALPRVLLDVSSLIAGGVKGVVWK